MLPSESSRGEIGYAYNDLESVERALERADGDCAAIFVGGASYPYSGRMSMPTPEFAKGVRRVGGGRAVSWLCVFECCSWHS